MRSRVVLLGVASAAGLLLGGPPAAFRSQAADRVSAVPPWLAVHVGDAEGQISLVVLERARALYFEKVRAGVVRNPCYFAMDATRPNDLEGGGAGRRFYVICEARQSFEAIPAGHGSGRNLRGVADFSNGRQCARNFGNALDSNLTAGGDYVTAETRTTFQGYYRVSGNRSAPLLRSFVQFDGEGETANARQREIGGHPAESVKNVCLRKDLQSRYADRDGYVRFGNLVDYSGGRSDGCTSWSPADAEQLIPMIKSNPTTLYIYPESRDIAAVARTAVAGSLPSRAGIYWNATCLKQIGAPRFWSRQTLEPLIARFKQDHPPAPARPLPICTPQ